MGDRFGLIVFWKLAISKEYLQKAMAFKAFCAAQHALFTDTPRPLDHIAEAEKEKYINEMIVSDGGVQIGLQ